LFVCGFSIGWDGQPSRAVDGVMDQNYGSGHCTHTQFESKPWWEVDLQQRVSEQQLNSGVEFEFIILFTLRCSQLSTKCWWPIGAIVADLVSTILKFTLAIPLNGTTIQFVVNKIRFRRYSWMKKILLEQQHAQYVYCRVSELL
jgi:hypothetical protein